jgi:TonB family protein
VARLPGVKRAERGWAFQHGVEGTRGAGHTLLTSLLLGLACLHVSSPSRAQVAVNPEPAAGAAVSPEPVQQAPVVVPPKLIYTPVTVYPEGAPRAPAEVLLKVTIAKTGAVTAAEVVTSAGEALDAAAVAAAQQFVFTPAVRDGVPLPAAISYLYKFEPEVAAPSPALPPSATSGELPVATGPGALEGQLLIAGAEVPLSGTLVVIVDASGKQTEVYTDADGKFVASGLPAGAYSVKANVTGFQALDASEDVAAGEATSVVYRLSEVSDGVEIVIVGEKLPREVTRRTLERREISKVPGTGGDALRAIQSLPGVARPPALAGLLIVRGSSPQDTNYFFDGALVPLVYHFGGLSSVVPTELLDRLDFYPGNFSTQFGRVTGGIVDVGLRSPDSSCNADYGKALPASEDSKDCFHGLAQADLIDARVLIQGPISKDWSFAVGGRRSWLDAWLGPVLEQAGAGVTTAPVYYDYQGIVEYRPNARQRLRLQLYGSEDRLKIIVNNPSAQDPAFSGSLQFSTGFYRGQLVYEHQLSPDVELNTTLAVGRDDIGLGFGPLKFSIESSPVALRTEFGVNVFKGAKLNVGMDLLAAPFDVYVRAPRPPEEGAPSGGPLSAAQVLEASDKGVIFRPGWYAEAEWQPSERWLVVPGLRLDYSRDTGHSDVSPRITGRYLLRGADSEADADGDKPRKTALKGGIGYFFKPPEFQQTNVVFGTPNLQSNRALHVSVGVEQGLTDQVDVSVEGYWKDLDRQVVAGFNPQYNNAGTGNVVGGEVLLKYKPDARFFGWVAYTLSRSVRKNGPGEREYRFQYDQTHNLIVLGSYRLGDGWEVGARFRVVSGNMNTPVSSAPNLSALYNADAGAFAPLEGRPFSDRLPLFHQLDVRLERAWQFASWRMLAYLDVWNAYNNAAVEDILYNFNYSQQAPQTGLPILPSIGLRGEF